MRFIVYLLVSVFYIYLNGCQGGNAATGDDQVATSSDLSQTVTGVRGEDPLFVDIKIDPLQKESVFTESNSILNNVEVDPTEVVSQEIFEIQLLAQVVSQDEVSITVYSDQFDGSVSMLLGVEFFEAFQPSVEDAQELQVFQSDLSRNNEIAIDPIYVDDGRIKVTFSEASVFTFRRVVDLTGSEDESSAPTFDAPTDLLIASTTSESLELTWNVSSEAESVVIERSLDQLNYVSVGLVGGATTNFLDTGLDAQTIYYYRIAAHYTEGSSDYIQTSGETDDNATYLFVSSVNSVANTSVATRDAHCQQKGEERFGGGSWVAFVSTSGFDARDRHLITGPVYNTRSDADGGPQVLANDEADFYGGSLQEIRYGANGEDINEWIATGTNLDGTASSNTCLDWTSDDFFNDRFAAASPYALDGDWVYERAMSCFTGGIAWYCIGSQ